MTPSGIPVSKGQFWIFIGTKSWRSECWVISELSFLKNKNFFLIINSASMHSRKDRKFRRTFESNVTNIPILLPRTMINDLMYFLQNVCLWIFTFLKIKSGLYHVYHCVHCLFLHTFPCILT